MKNHWPRENSKNEHGFIAPATYDETGGVDSDNPRSQLVLYINGDPYYNENFDRFLPNR